MSSETLDKTVMTDNWQVFLKKKFQHFIHHKKLLKVTKFQFKIICCSRVLNKNIPLWYIVPPPHPPPVLTRLIADTLWLVGKKENTCMFLFDAVHFLYEAHYLIFQSIFHPCYNSCISIKK